MPLVVMSGGPFAAHSADRHALADVGRSTPVCAACV